MSALPEVDAAARVGSLLSKWADAPYLSPEFWTQVVGAKAVAHRGPLRAIFDAVDQDPRRLREPNNILRQQASASFDDQDAALERLCELEQERAEVVGWLVAMGSPHVDAPLVDRDERAADEDDRRISQERQDEKAHGAAAGVRP